MSPELLMTVVLGLAQPAWAEQPAPLDDQTPSGEAVDLDAPRGPFLGEDWRYGERGLVPRAFADLVAIPASARHWRPGGWVIFGGVTASTLVLMAPLDPSPDARLDAWMYDNLDEHVPFIWGMDMQAVLWPGLAVGTLGTWGAAKLWHWPRVDQGMSLAVEAFSVSQLYHLSFKLLIGREGPEHGDALGLVLGPTESFRLFPAGTPSGHAASLFSLLGATQAWFRPPWPVALTTHTVVGGLVAMHVVNHRHFASDSLWGAAMGYAIGVWVVQHRSTDWLYQDGRPARAVELSMSPWVPEGGGSGLIIGGRW